MCQWVSNALWWSCSDSIDDNMKLAPWIAKQLESKYWQTYIFFLFILNIIIIITNSIIRKLIRRFDLHTWNIFQWMKWIRYGFFCMRKIPTNSKYRKIKSDSFLHQTRDSDRNYGRFDSVDGVHCMLINLFFASILIEFVSSFLSMRTLEEVKVET